MGMEQRIVIPALKLGDFNNKTKLSTYTLSHNNTVTCTIKNKSSHINLITSTVNSHPKPIN